MAEKKPKSLVGPLRGNYKLKKAPLPKESSGKRAPTPKPKVFMVAIGTANMMGEAVGYDSENKMRQAARAAFMSQWQFCARHNLPGQKAISDACEAIDHLGTFDSVSIDRRRISCAFDPGGYDSVLVVEMWRIKPPTNHQQKLI